MDKEYSTTLTPESKPTRSDNYFCNLKNKVKTTKIVRKYGSKALEDKWEGWNFKKNSGYKPIWSCQGYGGNCGCRRAPSNEKVSFKRYRYDQVC